MESGSFESDNSNILPESKIEQNLFGESNTNRVQGALNVYKKVKSTEILILSRVPEFQYPNEDYIKYIEALIKE